MTKKRSWLYRLLRYLFFPDRGEKLTKSMWDNTEQIKKDIVKNNEEFLNPQAKIVVISELGKQLVKKNQRVTGAKRKK